MVYIVILKCACGAIYTQILKFVSIIPPTGHGKAYINTYTAYSMAKYPHGITISFIFLNNYLFFVNNIRLNIKKKLRWVFLKNLAVTSNRGNCTRRKLEGYLNMKIGGKWTGVLRIMIFGCWYAARKHILK